MTGLFGSVALEVAIGLVFVYLLLAIFCTTVNEWLAALLRTRATTLHEGIRQLLDGQVVASGAPFLDGFYRHPLVVSMMRGGDHPSYLAAGTFARVLIDLATPDHQGAITYPQLEQGIKALPDGAVRRTLLALLQDTNGDLAAARRAIEDWFNDAMDRVSGWYKRTLQAWTVAIAMALTVASNADTIHLARALWTAPATAAAVTEAAKVELDKPADTAAGPEVLRQEQALMGQMIGWESVRPSDGPRQWTERILGWLLTTIAVSLGAPFWFDILNRFMNIRSAGPAPSAHSDDSRT